MGHSDEEAVAIDIAGRRRVPFPVEIERGGRVSVSTDCRFLTTARAGTARLIALETNRVVTEFSVPAALTTLATSPDGDGVAYTEGSRVTIVSARSKVVRGQWQAGQDVVRTAFDADGKRLMVSIGTRGTVMLDAGDARPLSESAARGILSPGGELAADLEREGRELVTWDVGRGVWTKRVLLSRPASNLQWSNDGEFLVYGADEGDGSARVLQSESWRQLARFAFPSEASSITPGASRSRVEVRISPSGNLASAANSRNGVVFEIHRDRPVVTLPPTIKPGPVALSGNGKRAAFRTMQGTISVVDTGSLRERVNLDCAGSSSLPMQLSANGRMLAATCVGGAHVVYDLEGGRPVLTVRQSSPSRMVMSKDGAVVLAGTAVFQTASGTRTREVRSEGLAALDPQGTRIAVGRRSIVELFDLRTTAAPRRLEAAIDLLESLSFSDDGALLAAGGRDMRVKIFNTSTGELVRVLEHIEQDQWVFRIHHLVFSPRGTLIATMSEDPTTTGPGRPGTMRVFEVATGRETARFPFPDVTHGVRFAADDSALEIAVGRRRLRWERYPLSPAGMIARACTLVQRQMAPIDWARFMGDEPRRETCPAVPH